MGRLSFVAAALLAAVSVRAQLGQNAPQVVTSFTELRDQADAAWTGSAAVAMYPPGMSFTNALPVFAVAAGFDPDFLAGLRETQTTEGIVLRSGIVRETAGATPQRQWFGAGAAQLAATPLPQDYDPVAWVLAQFPPPAFLSGAALESYIAERRLSRQAMTFTLLAEADVPAYLAGRAARIAAMPAGQFGEDDLGMSCSAYDPVARALRVLLVAPSYAGMLGVFETRDLRNPHPWALLATLPNTDGVVEFVYPDPPEQGVFRLSNLQTDSDLDGIADAVEELVLGTNAHAWDSAGDGISDWDRVFRLGGADTAGGVPAQVAYGLGLPGQDMSKVVSGPVELLRKAWRTERDKNGWTGFLDTRTRFLGLEHHQEYGPITWNTRYYGNTESSLLRYEKNDRQYVGGVLQDVVGAGELTPADEMWGFWSYANFAPPPPEYILSNTWSGSGPWSGVWHRRLSVPYTDPRLATLAAQDINALRSAGMPVPEWGQLLLRKRPAAWSESGGTDELGNALIDYDVQGNVIPNIPGYLLGPTIQAFPDTRGALEQSAFRVPKILEKPGEPDLLGGLELQAISWQASTVQPIPAGHIQRGVVLEVHRDPAPEGVYAGVVTRVVPREVFLKPTATGGESVVFTLPPPSEAGSVEVRDGYVGITINGVAEKDEETPGVFACVGDVVTFTVTGLDDRASLTAYRLRVTGPGGVAVAVTPSLGGAPVATPLLLSAPYAGGDAQSYSFPSTVEGAYEIVTEVLVRADVSEPEWMFCDRVRVNAGALAMAVDGNRDGEISFSAPEDQRYLFWLNNDHDVRYLREESGEPDILAEDDLTTLATGEAIPASRPATLEGVEVPANCFDDTIGAYVNYHLIYNMNPLPPTKRWELQNPSNSKRDLEDFARLHIRVSPALAADPTVRFMMKFEEIDEEDPVINLFEAMNASSRYLTDTDTANAQVLKMLRLTANRHEWCELDRNLVKPNGEVSPFIFEGSYSGTGWLTLAAERGGYHIATTRVRLELRDIQWFYDQYAVGVTSPAGTDPWNVSIESPARHEQDAGYTPASDEVFLLVHGWNMSELEKKRWAETAFKRLWWQGYQGRVALFSWPTLELPDFFDIGGVVDPRNFDNSEIRALRSAPALAGLFQALGPARLRVMAHSMGNVVASEALRRHTGQPVHSYIACQAALSAQYFDNTVATLFPCPPHVVMGVDTGTINTPDIMGHFMTGDANSSEYFQSLETKVSNAINYYNPSDWALQKWQINNVYRPADYGGYNFHYSESLLRYEPAPAGTVDDTKDRFARWTNLPGQIGQYDEYRLDSGDQRYVIFSYIAESRSVALGATFPSRWFKRSWGLNNHYGYDAQHYSHSRQFRSNVVDEHRVWKKMFEDFLFSTSIQGGGNGP